MTAASLPGTLPADRRPSIAGQLAYLTKTELLRLARVPGFTIPTVLFPILFFTFFGLPNAGRSVDGANVAAFMLASFGAYAALTVSLFSFGVPIAAERALGWNRLLRVVPMSPAVFFGAKILTAGAVGLLTILLLPTYGAVAAGISLPAGTWASLVLRLMAGMSPFVALGLWIGYVGGPSSAAPIANLIFLPLSFASGLFTPVHLLPQVVQDIAPFLPTYHSGQLAWEAIGAGDGAGTLVHLMWLAGYTAVFLVLGMLAYRRDEGRSFG